MSTSFPFPTGLYRAIGEEPVTVVAHDDNGVPTVVCVCATAAFERAAAPVLLEDSPDSFVVSHGHRYAPAGRVEVYDPARPGMPENSACRSIWNGSRRAHSRGSMFSPIPSRSGSARVRP